MAIVTGDRYLDFLVKFVERQAGPLLEGTVVLKLNPVGLHYVQSRIEALQELEALLTGAPVDYLRAYVSDLGDHRALEQLRRILRLLTSLKVVSVLPPSIRDPTPLSLLPFGRLRVLELRGCDLSTSAAKGLLELRHTLEKIICHNSTDALRHVFASRIVDIKASPVWNRLSFVSCACNGLILMDESLQLLPVVETLDLSRNRFAKVDNLRKCTKLRHLDLGFNHLRTITSFTEVASSIVKLVLRNNALTTLHGIENLKSVEGLDLSYNIISNFSELEIVASLPSLQSLWLEGNPICCARWYRAQVFSLFSHPEKLKLDDKGISTREAWQRQIIIASRQRRPAGFGFYSPAKADAQGEGSINAKRKKLSRLACIEDEEQRKAIATEAVEQESVSCDSEIRSREENVISDGEAEIVGLMNKVEYMKKERSVLWLREFKEWMDQTSEDMVDGHRFTGLSSPGKENYMPNKRYHNHIGESSRYVSDSIQASGDESSTNVIESDHPLADTSCDLNSYQYFHSISEGASESSILEIRIEAPPIVRVEGLDLKEGLLHAYAQEDLNHFPVEKDSLLPGTSVVLGNDGIGPKVNSMPLAAIDEILESHSFSAHPGSPPYYQENILHRRHNLEEEFMQLSAESLSLASSDSDTSCCVDDLCEFDTSLLEAGLSLSEESLNRSDDHPNSLSDDSYRERRHDALHMRRDKFFFRSCVDQASNIVELLEPDHAQQFCTNGMLGNADVGGMVNDMSEESGCLEKKQARRKSKKRIVSLLERDFVADNTGALSQKQNGILDFSEANLVNGRDLMTKSTTLDGAENSRLTVKFTTQNPLTDEFINNYFDANVADSEVSETCLQYMLCDSIFEEGSRYKESEVTLLLSSENRLYVLQVDATSDGSGTISRVIGCHRLEDIKEVAIGIGLQLLRVQIDTDLTYMFITRNIDKSRELLSLLQVSDSSSPSHGCSLKSLEQVQVESFENHICGGLKVSIFLYSMLLFWHSNSEEESWLSRSLFVIEGYMLVCIEDLLQLSSVTVDDMSASHYFSLDLCCCSISNISEMVIEPRESRCVTLTLDHVVSENFYSSAAVLKKEKKTVKESKTATGSQIWKLKWFSEETLLKFVALLKALHAGMTIVSSPC
ncbi:Leucine-rich repeat [Macleaya cordata]|uniref:Leucine-rich repeat n=1 Tax=Macleaya cordata TaxID=56857 RepID=A0A200QP54_MACCD|nr:Leucine-rich repeat [Macleaya cordata]